MMRYEMKDLGELNHYLGMKITRTTEIAPMMLKAAEMCR